MKEFILEEQILNIKNKKIREYLGEVITTFFNGEYRSCIVVLYAVTIVDLLNKIQILSEVYSDNKSTKFINEYKESANRGTKYSELEKKVINFAREIGIINDIEKGQWEQLREVRNYCAHPVISDDFSLILPNRDQVRAHIRNMFEAIFLKDAILHKKLFDEFFEKVSQYYERNQLSGLEEYAQHRYFSKLNIATKKVFLKNMWKIAFFVQEEDCVKNRQAIYHLIINLINSDKSIMLEFIDEERTFFNSKIFFEDIDIKKDDKEIKFYQYSSFAIIYLIAELPELFKFISDENKIEIKNLCYKNINLLLMAYYLFSSAKEHVENIKNEMKEIDYCINTDIFSFIYEKGREKGTDEYKSLAIYYYLYKLNSTQFYMDYDYINSNYYYMLKPILKDFNMREIKELIEGLHVNHRSANCYIDFKKYIANIVIEKGYDIDCDNL